MATNQSVPVFGAAVAPDRTAFLAWTPVDNSLMLHVTSGIMASSRDRVRRHREQLRRQGLRPVQIWVPDVRSPEFAAEAHRQTAAIAASEGEADDQAFVDAISSDWGAEDERPAE